MATDLAIIVVPLLKLNLRPKWSITALLSPLRLLFHYQSFQPILDLRMALLHQVELKISVLKRSLAEVPRRILRRSELLAGSLLSEWIH